MRNFRKAALAGATAVAVAFGSTAVATAASSVKDDTNKSVTTITVEEAQANVDKTRAEQEQAEKADENAEQQATDAKTGAESLETAAVKSEAEALKPGATQDVKDKAVADRKAANKAKAQQTDAETARDNAAAKLSTAQKAYQDAQKVLADLLKRQEIERIEKDGKGIDVYKDGVNSKDSDYAMGYDVFGKNKNHDQAPTWAVSLYGATWFLVASAIAGLVVGPLYNFIVHGPVKF